MRITDLLIDRRRDFVAVDPDRCPLFSFLADEEGAFCAQILTARGQVVAERLVVLSEAYGFRFADWLPTHGTRYRFCVRCGDTIAERWFETAVAFQAPFITPAQEIPSPRLIRRFHIPVDALDLRLAITGLGLYRAEINGVRVGDHYLTPGCNDYDAYLRFDTFDVTSLCRKGEENLLAVDLGDGWYRGRYGIDKAPHLGGAVWGEDYLCALMLYEVDSGRIYLQSDATFSATRSACVQNSIYDGEIRDFRCAPGKPISCRIVEKPMRVVPFVGAPIRVTERRAATLLRTPRGEWVLDFGVNMVGFVRFRMDLPRGARVRILHGEVLQDGCFYRDNLRTAKAEAVYYSDGRARICEPYFTFFGFRYAKVEGIDAPRAQDFEGVVLSSDGEAVSECVTSDERLNRLLANTRRSQHGNFLDIPTDCPQRDERLGWTADTQLFAATACYHSDCYAFYDKCLRDLRYEQTAYYGGDLPMYAPSLKGEAGNGGAAWADCATVLPTVLYRFYGDRAQLERAYPMMRDYCDRLLLRANEEGNGGLITQAFTFGDWLAQDGICEQALSGGTDKGYFSSLWLYRSLFLTSDAAEILGLDDDRRKFGSAAESVKAAILAEYFAPSGRLAIDTQTAYLLALRFGVWRDRSVLIRDLRERLRRDLYRMKTGFCGTPLLLPTLFSCGMDHDAYRILFAKDCPGWLYAIDLGATTIWERWNTLLPNGTVSGIAMNSLNHYAYGSVCEGIYGYVIGLRPSAPAWRSAIAEPHPNARLHSVSFSFLSPSGKYALAWRFTSDGRFLLDLTVPVGCFADLRMPNGARERLGCGTWHREIETPHNLRFPFSLDTPNLDVVEHPAAADCLRRILPRAWEIVTGENREFLAENGHFLLSLPMFGVSEADGERYRAALERLEP